MAQLGIAVRVCTSLLFILHSFNIHSAFKPLSTLRHLLTAPNDPIPTLDCPNAVYCILLGGSVGLHMWARQLDHLKIQVLSLLWLNVGWIQHILLTGTSHSSTTWQGRLCKESVYIIRKPQAIKSLGSSKRWFQTGYGCLLSSKLSDNGQNSMSLLCVTMVQPGFYVELLCCLYSYAWWRYTGVSLPLIT